MAEKIEQDIMNSVVSNAFSFGQSEGDEKNSEDSIEKMTTCDDEGVIIRIKNWKI